jgi:hypothetical protein
MVVEVTVDLVETLNLVSARDFLCSIVARGVRCFMISIQFELESGKVNGVCVVRESEVPIFVNDIPS